MIGLDFGNRTTDHIAPALLPHSYDLSSPHCNGNNAWLTYGILIMQFYIFLMQMPPLFSQSFAAVPAASHEDFHEWLDSHSYEYKTMEFSRWKYTLAMRRNRRGENKGKSPLEIRHSTLRPKYFLYSGTQTVYGGTFSMPCQLSKMFSYPIFFRL